MSNTSRNTSPPPRWTNYPEILQDPTNCTLCAKIGNDFRCLQKQKRRSFGEGDYRENRGWCPEADSNHRHADFQSAALPTELSGPVPANENSQAGIHRGAVGAP